MSADGYGLGVDIGDATITVAACTPDDERCAEPLRLPALPDGDRIGTLLDRVGDPVPLYVDGQPRTAADAVAAVVAGVVERVTEQLGAPPAGTVVTVPPSWTDHRRSALTTALAEALHGTATLTSGAVAVARHGRATGTVPAAATVAVYDLGASTLDTAVVRADDRDVAHVAPPPAPLPWGGRDVDDAVVRHVRGFLPTAPSTLRAACVAAKEALSTLTDVRVEVGDKTRPIRLVREDLDELLADALTESVAALRAAVTGAGLDPDELDGIVLAGGSARLPAVAETLSAELGRPVLTTAEPELAAACGAAELALDLLDASAVPTVELAVVADEEFTDDEDEFEDDPDDELAERRTGHRAIGSTVVSRIALVAALFVAIMATPVTLLATLDSGVLTSRSGGAATAADSPTGTTAPAPNSPAAATGPAGTTAATHGRSSGTSARATRAANSRSSSTAARNATASSASASVTTTPAAVAPVDTTTTTATTDPGTTTSAPVADPPATDPPATDPPATDPSATDPPATDPPATDPPKDPAPPPPADTPPPADSPPSTP